MNASTPEVPNGAHHVSITFTYAADAGGMLRGAITHRAAGLEPAVDPANGGGLRDRLDRDAGSRGGWSRSP